MTFRNNCVCRPILQIGIYLDKKTANNSFLVTFFHTYMSCYTHLSNYLVILSSGNIAMTSLMFLILREMSQVCLIDKGFFLWLFVDDTKGKFCLLTDLGRYERQATIGRIQEKIKKNSTRTSKNNRLPQ